MQEGSILRYFDDKDRGGNLKPSHNSGSSRTSREIERLRRELDQIKSTLKHEKEGRIKLVRKIAELVGVDLEEVIAKGKGK